MKPLVMAVLLAIIAGAVIHYIQHREDLPPAEQNTGWMQR